VGGGHGIEHGRRIESEIARHGVDTSRVIWTGKKPAGGDQAGNYRAGDEQSGNERAGLNFIETAAEPRPNLVLYDRAGSAISRLEAEELDFDYLASAKLLHLTGITPALSPACREAWLTSAQKAKAAGCRVAVDLNYRSRLWTPQEARAALEEIFLHVDLVLGALRDVQLLFGAPQDGQNAAGTAETFAATHGLPLVVLTLGEEGALAWDGGNHYRHPVFPTEVVDRIGAGDAFAAGFYFGWLAERDIAHGLRCGNALAALKQTYRGDMGWSTREELLELVNSSGVDPRRVNR
jgi:2-dehydro-3-deoxygluconokinase